MSTDFGDPIHHGGPSREVIQEIQQLTKTMSDGKAYFRVWGKFGLSGWQRLQSPEDYRRLNQAIDRVRRVC